MYDTHAHLDLLAQKLGLIERIRGLDLENLTNEQIETIQSGTKDMDEYLKNHNFLIQATVSTNNFLLNHRLFSDNPKVYFLVGSHPEMVNEGFDVDRYMSSQRRQLMLDSGNLIDSFSKVVGIGECGLDYYYSQDSEIHSKQKKLFRSQIELAIELDLPLIIHCRDAFGDLFEILGDYPKIHGRFLIHCFTGGTDEAAEIEKMGGKMAFGGVCTFNSAKQVREALGMVDINNVFLETDLPFLSPSPMRGETCLPEYIQYIADMVSEEKGLTNEELWEISEKNVKKFFNLP